MIQIDINLIKTQFKHATNELGFPYYSLTNRSVNVTAREITMSPRNAVYNELAREQTTKAILDAALSLFAQLGFNNTSISAIAKKAGISKGLIYHYFASKEIILYTLFDNLQSLGDDLMDQAISIQDPRDSLRYILDAQFDFITNNSELMRLIIGLSLQPDAMSQLSSSIEAATNQQIEKFNTILTQLGYTNPNDEAYSLSAMMDGICLGYLAMGEKYPLNEMKRRIYATYLSE